MKESIGRYGIFSGALRSENPERRGERAEAASELEELGYGAIWLGGNSAAHNAAPLIEATSRIVVGTGIQSIWMYEPEASATSFKELDSAHPGRFALGLGVSHARLAEQYRRPYSALVTYLDALDRAGVPQQGRLLAALGPKTTELARDRAAGAIPYLITAEQTARSRELLGEEPLLAPELKVILESDPTRARTLARDFLALYLSLPNYTNNLLRNGFTEDDLKDGGSDRLIDAVCAWGDETTIRARINDFHEAGADHVALQVVDGGGREDLSREAWRKLASLLA
ncbi:LLM class F420-dependent oxidoreductase [Streptomyces blattellae]|uniref:LLM class F420-dependent oxidoreductase n=1 Tax=Streptomyces blattellae TaxID=2569855 RepID=UPI0012B9BF26|nr:LLM class F420-dependent oxidoreductase [Streptomyces blattellae]